MLLSVIIPVYNEEQVISETCKQLFSVLTTISYDYEIIFINDGSKDNTLQILKGLAEKEPLIKIINFSRNFGHQCAITAGLNHCKGDIAVIMDADLQDPPAIIPEMIKLMETEKANNVYAVRKKRKGEPKWRLLIIKIFYRFLNLLSDIKIPLDTGDFRVIDRTVINQFNNLDERNKYIRGLICWIGFKQLPFYYERDARYAGKTKYPVRKLIKLATTGIFYFSNKPLNLAISLGFISIIIGLLYTIWILIEKLFFAEPVITGWTSTMTVIIFFGGVQLLTIGILGKYIGNLFDEVKKRPEYIVLEKINFS